ncbi:MAG: hypothetical protein ACE1ZA_05125, partial [Pseudomonadales bacterium]
IKRFSGRKRITFGNRFPNTPPELLGFVRHVSLLRVTIDSTLPPTPNQANLCPTGRFDWM